jgi:hypothetical protein
MDEIHRWCTNCTEPKLKAIHNLSASSGNHFWVNRDPDSPRLDILGLPLFFWIISLLSSSFSSFWTFFSPRSGSSATLCLFPFSKSPFYTQLALGNSHLGSLIFTQSPALICKFEVLLALFLGHRKYEHKEHLLESF